MTDDLAAGLNDEEKRRLHEIFAQIPFVHLIGMELEEVERGAATIRMEVSDGLKRNGGIVHGGAIASLIDSAAAFAIMTLLEPGKSTTTIDLTIHYLRPLLKGQARARARVVRRGRRVTVVSIDVMNDSEVITATALTSYLMLD
ncbi:MAG TPA: PaaI family thioesterase [Pyrinomonadaceae bacterium]|jgi:acyl-CoA thioesterase